MIAGCEDEVPRLVVGSTFVVILKCFVLSSMSLLGVLLMLISCEEENGMSEEERGDEVTMISMFRYYVRLEIGDRRFSKGPFPVIFQRSFFSMRFGALSCDEHALNRLIDLAIAN
mmetsp:Transcript_6656/g.10396  ORF Transcript_6656/g.10396 Transcript_6656/m.10396 type:complete len:115 (-) Transcript_6656:20-364(-)